MRLPTAGQAFLCVLTVVGGGTLAAQTPPTGALALTGTTLFDGTGAPPRLGTTIVMRDGRIAAVFPDGAQPLPDNAERRDATGLWVLPGLIDAHVHLATDPSGPDRRDQVLGRLGAALKGGVAGVRDMAGDARVLASLSRDAQMGDIEAPWIHYAAIFAGPYFFNDPRIQATSAGVPIGTAPWARAVTDTTDLPQAVAEATGAGVTGVKLYAALDGRLAGRIIAEAHRQGLRVWAHATLFPARPSELVAAGADVLSHALYLAWETVTDLPTYEHRSQVGADVSPNDPALRRLFAEMATRHVMLDPTLWVYQLSLQHDSSVANRRRARLAADLTRAAYLAGVALVAGTDDMGGPTGLPHVHDEMELLVRDAGLTPTEALLAATANGARAAGLEASHGTIAVGKAADLLVLRADPTADIRNTRAIAFVVHRGRVLDP